jgi:glucosamine--fructose-6-phosphate aminotransferase (isomerizing)
MVVYGDRLLNVQAYTSQFIALVMFALMMSEDRISMQARRCEVIQGLKNLPGMQCTLNRCPQ